MQKKISDLEQRKFDIIQSEEQREREKEWRKPTGIVGHKRSNMHNMGMPGREEKEKGAKCIG